MQLLTYVTTALLAATTSAMVAPEPVLNGAATALGAAGISDLTKSVSTVLTSEQIDGILPHRYPFALVDKVVEYEEGKSAVGIKSVTKVRWLVHVVWILSFPPPCSCSVFSFLFS